MKWPDQKGKDLKIYTLGQFKVIKGDKDLSQKYPRSSKPWLFFQFLITEAGVALPSELIIETLWGDNHIANPQHSLRNLVYRLRQMLEDSGEEQYIKQIQGNYCFNTSCNYWYDFEELERLSNQAFSLPDDDPQKIDLLTAAFELYRGEFLPSQPYDEWTVNMRTYCQRIFLKVAMELSLLYQRNEMWEDKINICERALQFEPFEDNLHRNYIQALINSEQKARARRHFHQTNTLFQEELGVDLGFDIEDLINNNNGSDSAPTDTTWTELQELMEKKDCEQGAFLCDGDNFRMIFQLEERRAERNIRRSSLVSLQLISSTGRKVSREELTRRSIILKETLLNILRKGDVICPNKPGEFFLLLVDVNPDKVDKILNRIADRFYQAIQDQEIRINVKHRPLLQGKKI